MGTVLFQVEFLEKIDLLVNKFNFLTEQVIVPIEDFQLLLLATFDQVADQSALLHLFSELLHVVIDLEVRLRSIRWSFFWTTLASE